MQTVALPLAVDKDGRLARTDPVTSLLALIRAMAASPRSTWAHAEWFGLQEAFASPALQRSDQHDIQARLNDALAALGITWATVAAVHLPEEERRPGQSTRRFAITLQLAGGDVAHRNLNV